MKLSSLRFFSLVAKCENISQAARELYVPQPAVSRAISELEKELNVTLFRRASNQIFLTEKGKVFLHYVEKGLDSIDAAVEAIQSETDKMDIYLMINCNRNIIFEYISEFKKENPAANFIIDLYNNSESISTYNASQHHQLCISASPVQTKYDRCVPLLKERLLVAVNKSHPLANQSSISLSELTNENFVLITASGSMHSNFIELCRNNLFDLRINTCCTDPAYVRFAVDNNLGVSVMPEISWGSQIGSNTVLIPLQESPLWQTTNMMWNSNSYFPRLVSAFKNGLRNYYNQRFGSVTR